MAPYRPGQKKENPNQIELSSCAKIIKSAVKRFLKRSHEWNGGINQIAR
jgi:hypothetical protein